MNMTAHKGSVDRRDAAIVIGHLIVAFTALLIGGIAGLLQGLVRGVNFKLPSGIGYYELLTAHGVLMAIIFTTYFIIGFLIAGFSKTTGGKLLPITHSLTWAGFVLMTTGTALGVWSATRFRGPRRFNPGNKEASAVKAEAFFLPDEGTAALFPKSEHSHLTAHEL